MTTAVLPASRPLMRAVITPVGFDGFPSPAGPAWRRVGLLFRPWRSGVAPAAMLPIELHAIVALAEAVERHFVGRGWPCPDKIIDVNGGGVLVVFARQSRASDVGRLLGEVAAACSAQKKPAAGTSDSGHCLN